MHHRHNLYKTPRIKLTMKKPHVISSVFLIFVLSLSISSLSWAAPLSSILDVTPGSRDFVTCIQSNSNNVTEVSQLIFTPVNSSFLPIWEARVNNARFNKPSTPKPSVIVTPVDETHVRTALSCSKRYGYEIRIRCGGHDFEGLSSTADVPFVMIDLINMRDIDVDVANMTAWVQGGAALGALYYAISQKTNTLYFPAGVCPTVGVGGYLSGAGYGNLMRKYGTGADNVIDVRFMDVNGNILDRNSMGEDLFWAIRGGGASSFGIVLAWKLRLVPVPEIVTVFRVNKTLEEGATELFYKYQYVAPFIDRNLLIRVQMVTDNINTKKTLKIMFEGIYQGGSDAVLSLMDQEFPELNVTQDDCEEVTMVQSTLLFGGLSSSTPTEILTNRTFFTKLNIKGKSDYVRTPIPISGLRKMFKKILENDGYEIIVINPFGGKMADYSETAIPYPHRAGVLYQMLKSIIFSDQPSDTTLISRRRYAWLRRFQKFLTPYVSTNPREAYSNYNDLDLGVGDATYEEASVWGERYWGRANFIKLIQIKGKVDPENFFRHPQSIPVLSTPPLSDI